MDGGAWWAAARGVAQSRTRLKQLSSSSTREFPSSSNGKESACNVGDLNSIPGLGRSSGDINGILLQYSCLENPIDGGASGATVHGVTAHAAAAAKSLQSCPTLCDRVDSSPPGSPVPGILQARTLEWVAISSLMHESEK